MEKYYTPSIEEFHVGFEYEEKSSNDGLWIGWEFSEEALRQGLDIDSEFRVKYLDHEDIESLGWIPMKFDLSGLPATGGLFEIKGVSGSLFMLTVLEHIKYPSLNSYQIRLKQDPTVLFQGAIMNRSELKRIMKMVGITETTEKNGTERS